MSDSERAESARAETEARDSSVRRTSRGPVAHAVEAAMTQYLAAEEFRERAHPPERPKAQSEDEDQPPSSPPSAD